MHVRDLCDKTNSDLRSNVGDDVICSHSLAWLSRTQHSKKISWENIRRTTVKFQRTEPIGDDSSENSKKNSEELGRVAPIPSAGTGLSSERCDIQMCSLIGA